MTRIRNLKFAVAQLEKEIIIEALTVTCGNVAKAARMMDLTPSSVWGKLRRHKIDPADYDPEKPLREARAIIRNKED